VWSWDGDGSGMGEVPGHMEAVVRGGICVCVCVCVCVYVCVVCVHVCVQHQCISWGQSRLVDHVRDGDASGMGGMQVPGRRDTWKLLQGVRCVCTAAMHFLGSVRVRSCEEEGLSKRINPAPATGPGVVDGGVSQG
jgi:hypothetical protein